MLSKFWEIDKDKDGIVDIAELTGFLGWLSEQKPEYSDFCAQELIQGVFEAFDDNNSGTISLLEFLACFHPSPPQVDSLVERIARCIYNCRRSLIHLFYEIDVDGDGKLSREEFRDGMTCLCEVDGVMLTEEQIDMVITHLDQDEDGSISWHEFYVGLQHTSPRSLYNMQPGSPKGSSQGSSSRFSPVGSPQSASPRASASPRRPFQGILAPGSPRGASPKGPLGSPKGASPRSPQGSPKGPQSRRGYQGILQPGSPRGSSPGNGRWRSPRSTRSTTPEHAGQQRRRTGP